MSKTGKMDLVSDPQSLRSKAIKLLVCVVLEPKFKIQMDVSPLPSHSDKGGGMAFQSEHTDPS